MNIVAGTSVPLPIRSNDATSAHAPSNASEASGKPAGNLNFVETDRTPRSADVGAHADQGEPDGFGVGVV